MALQLVLPLLVCSCSAMRVPSPLRRVVYELNAKQSSLQAGGKPFVLLGLPGAGKSTVGRGMENHGYRQVDNDAEIENVRGVKAGRLCDVADALNAYDTPAEFLQLEEDTFIDRFKDDSSIVYTPGGSIVHCPGALSLMMDHATVVWLDSPDEDAEGLDARTRGIVLPEGMTLKSRRALHEAYHHVKIDMQHHRKNEQAVATELARLAASSNAASNAIFADWRRVVEQALAATTRTAYSGVPKISDLHRPSSASTESGDDSSGSDRTPSPLGATPLTSEISTAERPNPRFAFVNRVLGRGPTGVERISLMNADE